MQSLEFSQIAQNNINEFIPNSSDDDSEDTFREKIWYHTYNTDPEVRLYHNFLSEGEVDYLIALGAPRLFQSGIKNNKQVQSTYSDLRTSQSGTFPPDDSVVILINNRIKHFMNATDDQIEDLQLLKYTEGQQFQEHFDWFTNFNLIHETMQQRQR